jgi:hypothetical protein
MCGIRFVAELHPVAWGGGKQTDDDSYLPA